MVSVALYNCFIYIHAFILLFQSFWLRKEPAANSRCKSRSYTAPMHVRTCRSGTGCSKSSNAHVFELRCTVYPCWHTSLDVLLRKVYTGQSHLKVVAELLLWVVQCSMHLSLLALDWMVENCYWNPPLMGVVLFSDHNYVVGYVAQLKAQLL